MVYEGSECSDGDPATIPCSAAFLDIAERRAVMAGSAQDQIDFFSDSLRVSGYKRIHLSDGLSFADLTSCLRKKPIYGW